MISKELRKLSRRELVDIIYQLKKNEQEKQAEIAALEEALQEKRIRISVAGSIAEAATDITQIFSVAQRAADLYLHEISCMKADAERECAKIIEEAQEPETGSGDVIGTVTANTTVNIRKSASQTSEKVGVVYEGEKLELLEKRSDGWSKIRYDGKTAYVKSEFVD